MNFQKRRLGVTLVEVLTSITVAVIGVAGVLVLIPFGIRQAQVGLDLDDSTAMAENALARFEIEGYGQIARAGTDYVMPWINEVPTDVVRLPAPMTDPISSCFWIDPLWHYRSAGNPTPANMFNLLGDASTMGAMFNGMPNQPRFRPTFVQLINKIDPFDVDASDQDGDGDMTELLQIPPSIAARIFQTSDDLQFAFETAPDGTAIDDRDPPRPFLDLDRSLADTIDNDGDGDIDEMDELAIRRQFGGEISWSAIAVQRESIGAGAPISEGFDFYILVYKDRSFEDPMNFIADRDPRMPVAQVVVPVPPNPNRTIFGTGTIQLVDTNNVLELGIRNDQWIMLVNFPGGVPQVGFFRVIGDDPANDLISIDGSHFELPVNQLTFAIALPNVVNVYKRQLELELTDSFSLQ